MRFLPLGIFLACVVVYSINGRVIAEVDCDVAPYAAWSLVQHQTFDVANYEAVRSLPGGVAVSTRKGSVVSKYPPGSTLAALPFVAIVSMITGDSPLSHSRMRRMGKHIASVYVAGAVLLIFLACRRLAPAGALPATVFAGFGTTLWSTASQGYWAHGPAVFFVALALFLLVEKREGPGAGKSVAAGVALGIGILCRPTVGLLAAASVVGLAAHRRWSTSCILGGAVAAVGVLLLLYNEHYFGNLVAGGYRDEINAWSTPIGTGLFGLLVAPSRGLLIYSPALLLLPFAARPLLKGRLVSQGQRRILIAWLVAAAATVFVYARWHSWWGGWSYGPRFLTEIVPILAVALALAWHNLDRRWGARATAVGWTLVGISVSIQFIGVFGYHVDWMATHQGADMFSLADTQIAARAATLIAKRPEALALPLLLLVASAVYARRSSRRNG